MLQAYPRPKSRQERLWDACSYGREETVRNLIGEGANINWRSGLYQSCPIHVASQGKPTVLKLLLDAGCDINARDSEGNSALHHASMTGHAQNALMLLAAGSSVDAQNNNLWTPLLNSAYWNHPGVTRVLLSNSADPFIKNKDGRNALHELCRSKSQDSTALTENLTHILDGMVAWLEKRHSADNYTEPARNVINARCDCADDFDFEADFTPLMFACYHGHLALAQALLQRGADIKATARNGWTALHWAAQRCHADIVELLLDHGASRSAEDLRGDMPCDVTNDMGLRECLLPDPVYPHIVSNGYATTDEEDGDHSLVVDRGSVARPTKQDDQSTRKPILSKSRHRRSSHLESDELAMLDQGCGTIELASVEHYDSRDADMNKSVSISSP